MVRDLDSFYPRKEEMGNGPIELVLGDVLDKVRAKRDPPSARPHRCVFCLLPF